MAVDAMLKPSASPKTMRSRSSMHHQVTKTHVRESVSMLARENYMLLVQVVANVAMSNVWVNHEDEDEEEKARRNG